MSHNNRRKGGGGVRERTRPDTAPCCPPLQSRGPAVNSLKPTAAMISEGVSRYSAWTCLMTIYGRYDNIIAMPFIINAKL